MKRIAPLFAGWEETLIWSCLQGCMGRALTDDVQNPTAAQIIVGDFCFFAGRPDQSLAARAGAPIAVPRDEQWAALLARVWQGRAQQSVRYATRKEPDVFDRAALARLAGTLPPGYELRPFDPAILTMARSADWSRDLCSQFSDDADYLARGLGMAVVQAGELVSGASSYTVWQGGIEIQIDTRADHRRRGLATACGASLILACLARGLYPSWDAQNLHSVALAEKLGYHFSHEYPVFELDL